MILVLAFNGNFPRTQFFVLSIQFTFETLLRCCSSIERTNTLATCARLYVRFVRFCSFSDFPSRLQWAFSFPLHLRKSMSVKQYITHTIRTYSAWISLSTIVFLYRISWFGSRAKSKICYHLVFTFYTYVHMRNYYYVWSPIMVCWFTINMGRDNL